MKNMDNPTMEETNMRRIALGSVVALGLLAGGPAAWGADASGGVDCADILKQDTSSMPAEAASKIEQAKNACGAKVLQDVTNALGDSKNKSIIDALTAIAAIKGNNGAIANPEKANHIGDMLAQMNLFEASKEVGKKLLGKIGSGSGKFVLITDPTALTKRFEVGAVSETIERMRKNMDALDTLAGAQIKATPAATKGEQQAMVGILPLIPPAIAAAQALASLARSSSTLVGIDVSAKAEVIAAGITSCKQTGIVLPQFMDGKGNAFSLLYGAVFDSYLKLKSKQVEMEGQLGDLKAGDKPKPIYASVKKSVDSQIAEFESLDKALQEIPAGKTSSPYSDLAAASASFGPAGAKTLMVTASHFGASGGSIHSEWKSDRLNYRSTVLLTYLLVDANGSVEASGSVPMSSGSLTSVTHSDSGLSPMMTQVNACAADTEKKSDGK